MASLVSLKVAASRGASSPYSDTDNSGPFDRYTSLDPYSPLTRSYEHRSDLPPKLTVLSTGGMGAIQHTVQPQPRGNILGRLGKHSIDVMGNIRGLTKGTLKLMGRARVIDSGSPLGLRFLGIFGAACGLIKGVNYIDRGYREYQVASKVDDTDGKVIAVATGAGIGFSSLVRGVLALPVYIMQILKEFIILAPAALDTLVAFTSVITVFSLVSWVAYVFRSAFKLYEMSYVESELKAMAKEVIQETYSEGVSQTIDGFYGDEEVQEMFDGARRMVRREVELEDRLLEKIETRLSTDEKFKKRFERSSKSSDAVKEYVETARKEGPDRTKAKSVWQRITSVIDKSKKNETKELLLFSAMLILTILDLCLTGGTFTLLLVAAGMLLNVAFLTLNDVPGYVNSVETNKASDWDRKLLAVTMTVMALALIATFIFTGGAGIIPLLVMGIGMGLMIAVQVGAIFYKKTQARLCTIFSEQI